MSVSDDATTTDRLLAAVTDLVNAAPSLPTPPIVELPRPSQLELEPVPASARCILWGHRNDHCRRGRRTYARRADHYLPARHPRDRARRTHPRTARLHTGLAAGMVLPDPADPSRDTIRVSITQHMRLIPTCGIFCQPRRSHLRISAVRSTPRREGACAEDIGREPRIPGSRERPR